VYFGRGIEVIVKKQTIKALNELGKMTENKAILLPTVCEDDCCKKEIMYCDCDGECHNHKNTRGKSCCNKNEGNYCGAKDEHNCNEESKHDNHKHNRNYNDHAHDHGYNHDYIQEEKHDQRLEHKTTERALGSPCCDIDDCSDSENAHVSVNLHGNEEEIPVSLLHLGDHIVVEQGKRFPADGVILEGSTSVDEAIITGESMPISKLPGEIVIGATTNLDGRVVVKVTALPQTGTVAKIVAHVEEAQSLRPQVQRIADVISYWFTPGIIFISISVFVVWFCLVKYNVYDVPGYSPGSFALQFSLSLLVVSCPCAIGLAVPTAVLVGTTIAAKRGLMIKGGPPFELLPKVKHVVFDKTGTLTCGQHEVREVRCAKGIQASLLNQNLVVYISCSADLSHD
jgi:magnesium-transporting ATPase (P-type)